MALCGTGHWTAEHASVENRCRSLPQGSRNCAPSGGFSISNQTRRHNMVDKDRIKGAAEQAKAKAKEWTGKATGDKKTEVEGKADQVKGKVQNAVGGAK